MWVSRLVDEAETRNNEVADLYEQRPDLVTSRKPFKLRSTTNEQFNPKFAGQLTFRRIGVVDYISIFIDS